MNLKIRFLGIGLFLSGLFIYIHQQWSIPFIEDFNQPSSAETSEEDKHLQEEIAKLQQENETLLAALEEANNNGSPVKNEQLEENISNEHTVITGTIYIYESVSIYDIGKQAEDLGIVKNGRELELFLSKPEYARTIQKGMFELNSSMTLEEMANILTGK